MHKVNKKDIYEYTEFESLNDLIKNISYISRENEDFIEEIKIIKKIICKCLDNDQINIIDKILNRGLYKISNPAFFENLILMFYDLKSVYLKDINKVIYLQNKFYELIETYFMISDKLSPKLNTSGLYLREFLDIRYLDEFEKTNDEEWIKRYGFLINNTIERLFSLCKLILSLQIDENTKKTYLINQLSELNKTLEYFDRRMGALEENTLKKEIITSAVSNLLRRKLELFYLILYFIETGQLGKEFFSVAMKLYNSGSLEKEGYFDFIDLESLDWFNYDSFRGGGQTISRFNQNKYRIVISLYKYLQDGILDIDKFKNENFQDYVSPSFKESLAKLDEKFIRGYFDFELKTFINFKKKLQNELKKKNEEILKKEEKHILNSDLKEEYIKKFKEDCKEVWKKNQEEIEIFLKIIEVTGGNKIKEAFGQYVLFDKVWFIESHDKNIGFDRSAGLDFGRGQIIGKKDKILKLIVNCFDNAKGDKKIEIGDIYQELSKITESKKEYYLFYNSDLKIYSIPGMNWSRKDGITASLKINNSNINFIHANIPQSILIEKDSFILKQYKQGFDKFEESLYVDIEKIDKKEALKSGKTKITSEEELMKKVKIRIAEKFELERNEDKKVPFFILEVKK